LSPAFASGTTTYTASVGNAVTSVDVTSTVADRTATLEVNGTTINSGSMVTIPLNVGINTITIVVASQDNATTKTYTVFIDRAAPPSGSEGSTNSNSNRNVDVQLVTYKDKLTTPYSEITRMLGTDVKISAVLFDNYGQKLNLPEILVGQNGSFKLSGVQQGNYRLVLNVIAPTGEKLAGHMATLTVDNSGKATVESELIDPYGIVRDSVTQQPIDGVKAVLYWADTELNRNMGRTPGTPVALPELPNFAPNRNHNPQKTRDGGQYGWMVYPDGDYYVVAEKDGYEVFDSRQDFRDEQHGESSYIRNGLIHVGQTIVEMDFNMVPKTVAQGTHLPYLLGYADGTFRPDNKITRAELATILSRILPNVQVQASALPFTDVTGSYWAHDAIAKVYAQHVMIGDPEGTFRPEAVVTRAEMAVVIAKIGGLPEAKATAFTDITDHWAHPFIAKVEKSGYISGYPEQAYRPNQAITRAETVVMINFLLGRKVQQVDMDMPQIWTDVAPDFWGYSNIMEASVTHQYAVLGNGTEIWKKR